MLATLCRAVLTISRATENHMLHHNAVIAVAISLLFRRIGAQGTR